ncbi:hypothetical protein CJ030_MR2G025502 [Morella rubra]|uniref:Uncharacterized protein n=1 Tax=Morella rubra TaxID=262757 RepID=A0A6A1UIW7_9ROSI|nr:hypothetical protein CJ030_MR0G007927 [Morella rubra]KAB1222370.1 hypothetical protein CJ030_MR2G025502 [Morella rubra]
MASSSSISTTRSSVSQRWALREVAKPPEMQVWHLHQCEEHLEEKLEAEIAKSQAKDVEIDSFKEQEKLLEEKLQRSNNNLKVKDEEIKRLKENGHRLREQLINSWVLFIFVLVVGISLRMK